jgi:hypothetical protein
MSTKPQQLQELETIAVLATFLLVLSLVSGRHALVITAIALLLVGLFVKPVASAISKVWLKASEYLGAFNSKVILTLVFFLFLTPMAVLYRMFSKHPMQLKNDATVRTLYWERNKLYSAGDFEKLH